MKKFMIFLTLFIILVISIYLFFILTNSEKKDKIKEYCNNETCIYTIYSINDVKDIPLINYTKRESLKEYNLSLVFIDPELSGNFTIALINLVLYLNRQKRAYIVCKYYKTGCNLYVNSSIDRYTLLFQNNESFLIDTNKVLLVFIENSNNSGIEIYKNNIYLYGNESTIVKVLDKFLLYWYGFIDN